MKISEFLDTFDFSAMIYGQGGHSWEDSAHYIPEAIIAMYPTREICKMYEENAGDVLYSHFILNQWKYNGLYDIMELSYDPLDNVNEITEETTYLGKRTSKNSGGNYKNTESLGGTNNTSRVAYDSYDMLPDASSVNSGSNTNEFERLSDDVNTVEMSLEDKDTFTRNRHGNIGITTNGQLIDDYKRTKMWSFYQTIINDIIALLCLRSWEVDE